MTCTFGKEWNDIFFDQPNVKRVKEFSSWLKSDPNRFLTLYHGTDATLPIMRQGLLPTSSSRRRSLQSAAGYVYLSVYPNMAYEFGRLGCPLRPIVVYAVTVTVRRLLADLDQLSNKAAWAGLAYKPTLANSLVYGHSARVKGKIDPYQIRPHIGECCNGAAVNGY